jgi:hypothetical protein
MAKLPQSPSEWNNDRFTLFREFHFNSKPDIEILIKLVKENIPDKGNKAYIRARLIGILQSYWDYCNNRFWLKHYHPKTWWFRFHFCRLKRFLKRKFNTPGYKAELMLCSLAREVAKECTTD